MDETLDTRLEEARTGGSTAWRALVGEHLSAVYAVCRAFGLDGEAAAEVNQALWLRFAEHLRRIRTPAAVGGWIAATARRECLDPHRDAGRRGWITGGLVLRLDDRTDFGQVADCVALGRSFGRIGAYAQRLLRLSAVRPQPSDEVIAAALDIAVSTVPVARQRSLDRLERLVQTDPAVTSPVDVEGALAGAVNGGDPVPASWWHAAEAAFGWLTIDAELADMVYDSTFSAERDRRERFAAAEGANADHGPSRRSLRFSTGPRQVDVIIDVANGSTGPAQVSLSGRIDTGKLSELGLGERGINVRYPWGTLPAAVGPDGAFYLHDLPLTPLCVEVEGENDEDLAAPGFKTGWIFP